MFMLRHAMIYTACSIYHKTHTIKPSDYFFTVSSRKNLFIHIMMLICFFPMCWHWPNLTTIMVFPIPMNMPNSPYQANPINGIFMRAMNTPIQTSHQCLIGNQWYSLKFARAHWWARISQHEPTGLKNEKHIKYLALVLGCRKENSNATHKCYT